MACFSPVVGWRDAYGQLTLNEARAVNSSPKIVPCGGCVGCRATKTSEWAARAVLELRACAESSFVTLTYSPDKLPPNGSLMPPHLKLFWKALRQRLFRAARSSKTSPPVLRYFACGEYGELKQRPHYHAIIFGWCPPDGVLYKPTQYGPLYTSKMLESTWGRGFCTFGAVGYESCAYVASYVQKKLTGYQGAVEYSDKWHPFAVMSKKPGLGIEAAINLRHELHDDKLLVGPGRVVPLPRYFMDTLKVFDREAHGAILEKRAASASTPRRRFDMSPARLKVREEVFLASLSQGHKEYHHGNV